MCCTGFKHFSLDPCNRKGVNSDGTCYNHRNFYVKENWKRRFLSLGDPKYLLETLDYTPGSIYSRIHSVIKYSLANQIVLTEEDIEALYVPPRDEWDVPQRNLSELFLALCEVGKISPIWNPSLLKYTIYQCIKRRAPNLRDLWNMSDRRISILLAMPCINATEVLCLSSLYYGIKLRRWMRNEPLKIMEYMQEFIHEILESPHCKEYLLLSRDDIVRYITEWNTENQDNILTKNICREALLSELEIARKRQMFHLKARMLVLKEDLMAAAWHPDRVAAWLRAGRLVGYIDGEEEHAFDVLDMMCGYD